MKKLLILFSSTDGHTKIIAETIAQHLSENYCADIVRIADSQTFPLDHYDLIIIGAVFAMENLNLNFILLSISICPCLTQKVSIFRSKRRCPQTSKKYSGDQSIYAKIFKKNFLDASNTRSFWGARLIILSINLLINT